MNLALLWSLAVGTVLPALTALVTKEKLSAALKSLVQALLAGVTGAVSGFVVTPPHGTAQWEQIAGAILVAWVTAGAAFIAGWVPTGAIVAIAARTARFGIGPATAPEAGFSTVAALCGLLLGAVMAIVLAAGWWASPLFWTATVVSAVCTGYGVTVRSRCQRLQQTRPVPLHVVPPEATPRLRLVRTE